MVSFRNTGWTHNQLTTGGAGSGGQGRRNHYMATPQGVETPPTTSDDGSASQSIAPRFQPFSPKDIVKIDLGTLLVPEEQDPHK